MKTLNSTLALTLIMVFFSERFFWGNFRPEQDTITNYITLYIFYGCLTYIFLFFLHGLRKINLAQLFIGGLMYALVTEVVVAGLLFSFPISFLFSQPYHVIFTVLIGLFWLPRVLTNWSIPKIILLMMMAGGAYGLWSFGWSASVTGVNVSYFNYIPYITFSTLSLVAGYFLLGRVGGSLTDLAFTKIALVLVSTGLIFLSFLHYQLFAIPVLLILTAILYWLWKLTHSKLAQGSDRELVVIKIPLVRLSLLLIFPVVSSFSAWFCYAYLPDPTGMQYIFMTPLVGYFFYKLYRVIFKMRW